MKQREEFLAAATKSKLQAGRIRKKMEDEFTWTDEEKKRHCSNRWDYQPLPKPKGDED